MKIVVGLGNPGAKYASNRHNIGFMAIDRIHSDHRGSPWRKKFQADVSEVTAGGVRCLLMKPTTFMNDSGRAVSAAAQFYKISVGDVIVLHDELDLAPAKVRAKTGGGHAGHNGLRSIQAHCGADFVRLRLGIGHPGHKDKVHSWVLGDFAKADQDWVDDLVRALSDQLPLIVGGQLDQAMSLVGQALAPASAPRKNTPKGKAAAAPARTVNQGAASPDELGKTSRDGSDMQPAPRGDGPLAAALRGLMGGGDKRR